MAIKQVFNTSAELDYPTVLPTLDLDFANSKTLDPRITFTRASGGSYVGADGLIKYAGVNEPRFDHDPATGESLGLLVEESRTNLLKYSEEFDQSYWVKTSSGATITPNNVIAPDGSLTADLVSNVGQVVSLVETQVTVTASSTNDYYATIYAKKSTASYFTFNCYYFGNTEDNVSFNFDTGVVSGLPYPNDYIFENVGNGWYKCGFRMSRDSTGTRTAIRFRFWESGRGVTSGNTYFWGAQLEQGAFPTSYIPTQGSTRTRQPDSAIITGKNFSEWYKQIGYTIFSEHITTAPSSVFPRVFNISTSTDAFRLNHYQPPLANYVGVSAVQNSINSADIRYFNITQFSKAKMATTYDLNNIVLYVNGNFVGKDTTTPYPSENRDRINIGSATPSGSYINSTISKITYYPYPLKDNTLQSLTS